MNLNNFIVTIMFSATIPVSLLRLSWPSDCVRTGRGWWPLLPAPPRSSKCSWNHKISRFTHNIKLTLYVKELNTFQSSFHTQYSQGSTQCSPYSKNARLRKRQTQKTPGSNAIGMICQHKCCLFYVRACKASVEQISKKYLSN